MNTKNKNPSIYRGVSLTPKGKFRTIIAIGSCKTKYIGTFNKEEEAALAYDRYVIENNLEKALNFPEFDEEEYKKQPKKYKKIKLLHLPYYLKVDNDDYFRVLYYAPWSLHVNRHRKFNLSASRKNRRSRLSLTEVLFPEQYHNKWRHFMLDGDRLNWQRKNIIFIPPYKQINTNKRTDFKTSKYRGVTKVSKNRYKTTISYKNEKIYLGTFKDAIKAAKRYDEVAKIYQGKRAKLNFPKKKRKG